MTDKEYAKVIAEEIMQLDYATIKELHDKPANGVVVPAAVLTEEIITKIMKHLNKDEKKPKRGYYSPYVEQVIIRHVQNRKPLQ